MIEKIKKNKKTIFVVLSIIILIYIICICPKEMQNDTFWSIKIGEKLINEGIWQIDDFSIHDGLYYIAHHFLTDILIYIVYIIGNFTGLYILEIVLAMLLAYCIYLLNYQITKNKFFSLLIIAVQMFLLTQYIAVRAQLISYIIFVLELLILERYQKEYKKRYIIGLCVLPLLLANFHMGVIPFYFIILMVYMIGFFEIKFLRLSSMKYNKKQIKVLILVLSLSLIIIFINPYFIKGVTYSLKTMGNQFINAYIAEFQAISVVSPIAVDMLIYTLIIILLFIFTNCKIYVKDFLLFLGTLVMSFMAYRYIALFIICTIPVLKYYKEFTIKIESEYGKINSKSLNYTIYLMCLFLLIIKIPTGIKSFKDYKYIPTEKYPVKAVEWLYESGNTEKNIFNEYSWGSYLMLNNIKVYIDSRCDLYTKEYNNTTVADDYGNLMYLQEGYDKTLEKYDIEIVLLERNTIVEKYLRELQNWKIEYKDNTTIIFMKE